MPIDIPVLRDSFKVLPPVAASAATNTPDLRSIFTPAGHSGALDPTREIVVGDRGVGKSFWSSVLQNDAARTAVSAAYPALKLKEMHVSLGFSETLAAPSHPSARTIVSLMDSGFDPELIWRAIFIHGVSMQLLPAGWSKRDWKGRCEWISENVEKEEVILQSYDTALGKAGRSHLFIFDALDRLGNDWKTIRALTKSLFTIVLEMRSFPHLHSKLFIRPDMESDREIWAIRDGSKLKQNIVNLSWSSKDLYGFVWHWLLSDPEARPVFTELCAKKAKIDIYVKHGERLIEVPETLLDDEDIQKKIFETLAGDMMGAGSKKGHPYTWIPKHLADARGRVSLRGFIIALRDAAKATPTSAKTALTHEKIKEGVVAASSNRIEQLKEDYIWIDDVLRPLKNLLTPNFDKEYISRWRDDDTVGKIFQLKANDPECLIPVELEGAKTTDKNVHEKLIFALINTGVAERRGDGRLNIPDLFQVAAGIFSGCCRNAAQGWNACDWMTKARAFSPRRAAEARPPVRRRAFLRRGSARGGEAAAHFPRAASLPAHPHRLHPATGVAIANADHGAESSRPHPPPLKACGVHASSRRGVAPPVSLFDRDDRLSVPT